jgi:hypothetical protein
VSTPVRADRHPDDVQVEAVRAASPITTRAVLLGAALVLVLVITNPYLAFVIDYWTVGSGAVMNGPVAALFLLVLANGAIKRFLPRHAFRRGELLTAYAMTIVSVALVQAGGLPYIAATTTYPYYFATPENQWSQLVWPHFAPWLQLRDLRYAAWFWEGAPAGAGVPWGAWANPLIAWGSFLFAMMVAIYCLAALVRRDWIERQRLSFPIVDIPLAITGDDPTPSLRTSLLNNRLFWLGFAVPAAYVVTDWLNLIFPSFPSVRLHDVDVGSVFRGMSLPWGAWSDLRVSIIFPVIGVSFLVPTEVSLSLWLFYVLFRLHMLAWGVFGVGPWGGAAAAVEPYTFHAFMEAGGAAALCGVILYRSRRAIGSAVASLLTRRPEAPDPYSPLSYRGALLGFAAANAFMVWWMVRAGASWWSFALVIGLGYATMLCSGYLMASGGVMFPTYTASASEVLLGSLGGSVFTPASLAMVLTVDSMFLREGFPAPLPQMLNAGKLFHSAGIRARRFTGAAAVAVAIAIVSGLVALLLTIQPRGASTMDQWPWSWPGWSICSPLAENIRSPRPADTWLRSALGLGAGFVLLMVWLQSRFLWWPLSPYGFLIASTYLMNHMMWASIFIGWLAAAIVLRYGGLRLFRQLRPLFLGLVLGYYITKLPITALSALLGVTQRWGLFSY